MKESKNIQAQTPDMLGSTEAIEIAAEHPALQNLADIKIDDQVRALIMLLLAERQTMNPEEVQRIQMRMEYAFAMQQRLIEFSETFAQLQTKIHATQKLASALLNRRLAMKRNRTVVGENSHVVIMDRLAKLLRDEMDYMGSFLKANHLFVEEAKEEEGARLESKILLTDPRVRKTIERVDGFLDAIDDLQQRMNRFPELCREISRAVNRYRRHLANEYGKEEDDEDKAQLPSFFFSEPSGPKDAVPIYKDNIHLTGFLHEAYDAIPLLVERKKSETPKVDPAEVRGYMEYLRSLAETKLLGYFHEGGFFPEAAKVLEKVCGLYSTVQRGIDRSSIERERTKHPEHLRLRFRDEIARNRRLAGGEEGMRGKAFSPGPILSLLRGMNLHTMPSQIPTLGADEGSKKERTMLRIFAQLEEKLTETAKNDMEDDEWDRFILEIAGLKYDIRGSKSHRRRARIRKDRMDENWAYRVQSRGVRSLDLKQIATTDITFDDVIGKSWKKVREAIDDVLQWDRLEHIFTTLHPRGNAKKHLLTFGAWGIGKNHFSRAILNDPRVIGVTLTTGDVGTAYVNESEANIGRLFDECRSVRDKHGKPVMIVWDEFDDLFPKKGNGENGGDDIQKNIRTGMQKELQACLDGNNDNSGIFLFGMSNAPENIPIEIYRRMRHIGIVEPLDDVERHEMLNHLLHRMPLEDDFMPRVDISWMSEATEDASGEVLGMIIDETYERLVDAMRQKNPSGLMGLNDIIDDAVRNGEKPTVDERLMLIKEVFPDTAVSPEMFQSAAIAILRQPGITEQMKQQQEYYRIIDSRLSQAFENWQARPDFLPPAEPEERTE